MPERPFSYRVRTHPRARHIRFRVSAEEGVLVTIPPRLPRRALEAALDAREQWIVQRLEELAPRRAAARELPTTLKLAASGEHWLLHWQTGNQTRYITQPQRLELNAPDADAGRHLLGRFVRARARLWLPQRLQVLAERTGLLPSGCSIRRQKTRWGSCSARGHISLNDRLMFLPPELVDHVLLHELAHLREPHHGPAFHRLLARLDPKSRAHHAALRQAGQLIPPWLPDRL